MVDEITELPVNPDSSQSLFDSSQAILQSPPVEIKPKKHISKLAIFGLVILFLLVVVMVSNLMMFKNKNIETETVIATPSPTPNVVMDEKEKELKRVELILEQSNPENLLVLPPQVDMEIEF